VPITDGDLARLVTATARPAVDLVDFLAPDEVDMTGEPSSFVELRAGRRLMVLAHRSGTCVLQDEGGLCSVHRHRPLDCRLYPFDLSNRTGQSVLGLLPLGACAAAFEACIDLGELAREDEARWAALSAYQARVARWNRLSRHRRRFGHRLADHVAFLEWLLGRSASERSDLSPGSSSP
jgi:Fe-S-cluster containining protein